VNDIAAILDWEKRGRPVQHEGQHWWLLPHLPGRDLPANCCLVSNAPYASVSNAPSSKMQEIEIKIVNVSAITIM
jgi:hypothetical protein